MKQRLISVLIGLFWIAVFGYLLYKGFYAVVLISAILLGMTLAFATSNEN